MNRAAQGGEPPAVTTTRPLGSSRANRDRRANSPTPSARLPSPLGKIRDSRPLALDLFCGGGGATKGLQRAGFHVTGIDVKPQPRYCGDLFIQADALNPPVDLAAFDFIWASPPCQAFTNARVIHGNEHPDRLTPTREMLVSCGVPLWVIENVPGAPMRADYILCGSQFGERRLKRHRWFEVSWDAAHLLPPCDHARGEIVSVFGHGGHIYHGVNDWRDVMGIEWMTRDELAQAIPPAYSEYIARQMFKCHSGGNPRGNLAYVNEPLHADHKSGESFHDHRKEFRVPDAAKAGACGP